MRLPDETVDFIDRLVHDGKARSRAAVVGQAVERERRRLIAARDAAILAAGGDDPDLQRLAEHLVGVPLDID